MANLIPAKISHCARWN